MAVLLMRCQNRDVIRMTRKPPHVPPWSGAALSGGSISHLLNLRRQWHRSRGESNAVAVAATKNLRLK
jgi:hypothetical protein